MSMANFHRNDAHRPLLAERADLRAYVDDQIALKTRLQAAFAPLLTEAISDACNRLCTPTPPLTNRVMARGSANISHGTSRCWPHLASGSSSAAIERSGPELPFVRSFSNGQVVAQGELADALNVQLASAGRSAPHAHIGLSFRSRNGEDCRTFEWRGEATATSGVACHTADEWAVAAPAKTARTPNDRADYQMAGAGMPDAIRNTVNAMIAGEPYNAAAERAARGAHWRGAKHP
jgi:hypothetical protein